VRERAGREGERERKGEKNGGERDDQTRF